ncbi:PLD nuclease N-terminal domain-containing protein [Sphaerisporangium sp. B11E5]|uniref:PLD nuclease N-terminal domain-containing protein n=1 Tax=Sphaerisporangium sp. B11E5 TaxID=3153563 RepID=UPI00325E0CB7
MNTMTENATRCGGNRKRWSDLTEAQKTAVLVAASTELALTATAAVDLFRRPQRRLRGSKALWWPILAIQPFGPIAYLTLARRPRQSPA